MKVKELIAYARGVRPESPSHAFSDDVLLIWINEIEGMVQTEILLTSPADIITYTADDLETELLVPAPHSKIYRAYLCSMIDFERGEYNTYSNSVELFREWWNEYAAWYALMYDPASGKGELKGYYVSAYAIAVKHGYKGTEEEWLSELDLRVKDAEKHAAESAASAASAMIAVTKYPMIGEDGYWYVWDTVLGEYVKTSVKGEGSPGPAGNGIASITHTGVRDAVNPNFPNVSDGTLVSDVYTITYTDGGTFELVIPRGSRIFTGGYDGVGESIGKDDGIILNVTALQGDYYISKVTGHMWRKASDADQAWEYITTLGGGNFDMAADASKYLAITALQNYDAFIVHDLPGKTMGKITWDRLRSIISSTLEGSVFAAGIIDNNSGCSATLPELEDDTTLLTEADIPRIVAAVIAELNK